MLYFQDSYPGSLVFNEQVSGAGYFLDGNLNHIIKPSPQSYQMIQPVGKRDF